MEKHPDLIALGENIRRLRKAADMTQADLAGAAGLSVNYVGETERGERNPSYLKLIAFAKALRVAPSVLLEGYD